MTARVVAAPVRYRFAVAPHSAAETIEAHGCRVVLRRVDGPLASELFFLCRPAAAGDAGAQAENLYHAAARALEGAGGSLASVVSETLFLRSVGSDLEAVRAARARVVGETTHRPARTEIEQPPLDEEARLTLAVQAVVPHGPPLAAEGFGTGSACGSAGSHGLRIHLGGEARLYAGALHGHGADAYEQTLAMFAAAEELLQRAGMEFRDVVRTWIHLREMDRDYADLNRARRAFFEARGIDPAPASTGIGGGPAFEAQDLCMGLYAVAAAHPPVRRVMSAPTLNEATQYGSDFARGMRVEEANKVALHVSGTASIDEAGATAHTGDFDAQVERMLVNVAALLEGQGAGFGDVVSAITYLKRREDAVRLREKLREAGFEGFPNALVLAPICRPELLCETEALAVLPRDGATRSGDVAGGAKSLLERGPGKARFAGR